VAIEGPVVAHAVHGRRRRRADFYTPRTTGSGTIRIAVLVSGSGTNLQALIDHAGEGSGYVDRVRHLGPPGCACARTRPRTPESRGVVEWNGDRRASPSECVTPPSEAGAEALVLAGFMRILGPEALTRFPDRILNIHPSLLPAFPGQHAGGRHPRTRGPRDRGDRAFRRRAGRPRSDRLPGGGRGATDDTEFTLHQRSARGGAPAVSRGGFRARAGKAANRGERWCGRDRQGCTGRWCRCPTRRASCRSSRDWWRPVSRSCRPVGPPAPWPRPGCRCGRRGGDRSPEMLGGRVKTLHPSIHGGSSPTEGRTSTSPTSNVTASHPFQLVVSNLYPFRETVATPGAPGEASSRSTSAARRWCGRRPRTTPGWGS
jgi:hypothetical protein